jgi:predicted O-methyltransferase YrrM
MRLWPDCGRGHLSRIADEAGWDRPDVVGTGRAISRQAHMALNVGRSNGCSRAHRFTANSQQRGLLRRPVDTWSAPPDAGVPRRPLPSPVMSAEDPPGEGTAEGAAYADRFAAETPEMTAARDRAFHLPGSPPVEPAVGATMAVLAAGLDARSVVSIGSGGGLAGLWLMRGMRPDGVLTALDGDPEQLRAARKAFADAGIAPGRMRLIFGTPAEVLPRLSPGAYDMVVCAGPPREYSEHLRALLDLVRVGGSLVCHGLLEGGRIADRTARDPQSVAWREVARTVREEETLLSAVLPIGAGLLVATKRA